MDFAAILFQMKEKYIVILENETEETVKLLIYTK